MQTFVLKTGGLQVDNLERISQQIYLSSQFQTVTSLNETLENIIDIPRPPKTKLRTRRSIQQQEIFTIEGLNSARQNQYNRKLSTTKSVKHESSNDTDVSFVIL